MQYFYCYSKSIVKVVNGTCLFLIFEIIANLGRVRRRLSNTFDSMLNAKFGILQMFQTLQNGTCLEVFFEILVNLRSLRRLKNVDLKFMRNFDLVCKIAEMLMLVISLVLLEILCHQVQNCACFGYTMVFWPV